MKIKSNFGYGFVENNEFISSKVQFANQLAQGEATDAEQNDDIEKATEVNAEQEADIENLKSGVEDLQTRVENLESASGDSYSEDIEELKQQVQGLTGDIGQINESISGFQTHVADDDIHVSEEEFQYWNNKADESALVIHTNDTILHVTARDKETWNGKQDALANVETLSAITADDIDTWNGKADTSDVEDLSAILSGHVNDSDVHVSIADKEAWGAKLDEEAIANFIDNVEYSSDDKKIYFKHGDSNISEVDATDFLKDGMIESVAIENGYIVMKFNTDAGIEAIKLTLTDIFNPDNYLTKSETQEALSTKASTDDLAQLDSEVSGHTSDGSIHVTEQKKAEWDAKADASALAEHVENSEMHVTTDEKVAWNSKVAWTESTPGRNHIVLKNHDSILGTAKNNETYNLAMVSKWDVADFGSSSLHLNLNSKDGIATINDDKAIATEDFVTEATASAVDGLASASSVTAEIADAIEPLATKAEVGAVDEKVEAIVIPDVSSFALQTDVDAALSGKADADNVYTKDESDEKFQESGDYVPVEQYNALAQKVASLENYVNIFIKDREEKMDEIISNMDADNKEVVIETPMESIVVPETTVAYTITAPLSDNSTVELTSPKYMTLFNTSAEPVSTSIGHAYQDGETTAATTVYLVGDFDTLTLENVSPAVKSGQEAATVNNVVITENNVKNLTLALDIQDGATIRNESNANITIQDKNNFDTTITIIAPNSTVTLNGSNYEVVNATVSDNTLIIKKNVGHIGTLNVEKGNVIVEVARESLINEKIGEYKLPDGATIDFLHDEITSANIANLTKEGTHVLMEDIAKSGNFSVGLFSSDDIIWDLNGHTITCSNTRGFGNFTLRGTAHLEINDSSESQAGGVINASDEYGFWTSTEGAKVVINGGYFEASTHVLYAEKGTIEVNGGTFKMTNWETADKDENGNLRFLLNCLDASYREGTAHMIVRGGKFYDFDPGNCAAEGAGTSFLAEGFGTVMTTEVIDGVEHKVYEVKPLN